MAKNIYQFKVEDLVEIHSIFQHTKRKKKKKILVVNTASECGLTPAIRTITSDLRKVQRQKFRNP